MEEVVGLSEALLLPIHESWTFADLKELPNDGYRYEIIDGLLIVSPAPTARHRSIAHLLSVLLQGSLPKDLRILPAAGVLLESPDPTLYLIPDLLVVHAANVTDEAKNLGPADVLLAVEIVSPSTGRYDLVIKRDVYAELGIRHYWVVESRPPGSILALTLGPSGTYVSTAEASGDDEFVVDQPFPVRIIPAALRR